MKKRHVYILFGFLVLLLAVHFKLSMKGIEPYPAFFYPEFTNLVPSKDKIDVIKPEFTVTFEDGKLQTVDHFELFDNLPVSHVNHLIINHLNPTRKFDPARFQDKPMKSFRLGRFTYEFQRTPFLPSTEDIEQRNDFFRDRIYQTTLNETPAARLDIIWYRYEFVFGKGWIKSPREKVYGTALDLSVQ